MKREYSEGIKLGIVSIFSYVIYYCYMSSYFEYYGIPKTFVTFSIEKMIGLFAGAYVILFFIFIIVDGVYSMIPSDISIELKKRIKLYIFSGIFLIFFYNIAPVRMRILTNIFTVIILLVFFIEFVIPIIKHKSIKGYWKRIDYQLNKKKYKEDKKMMKKVVKIVY